MFQKKMSEINDICCNGACADVFNNKKDVICEKGPCEKCGSSQIKGLSREELLWIRKKFREENQPNYPSYTITTLLILVVCGAIWVKDMISNLNFKKEEYGLVGSLGCGIGVLFLSAVCSPKR